MKIVVEFQVDDVEADPSLVLEGLLNEYAYEAIEDLTNQYSTGISSKIIQQ